MPLPAGHQYGALARDMTASKRAILGAAVGIVGCAATGSARAQAEPPALGATRQLAISLERVVGFTYGSMVADARENAPRLEETGTGWGPLGATPNAPRFAVPRLALDGFVGRRFSVGGAFGYARRSSEAKFALANGNGSTTFTTPAKTTESTLVLAARVGYLAPLSRAVSIWPRVGFTYLRTFRDAPPADFFPSSSTSERFGFYALTLEAPIVVRIVDHIVATAGPTLDLSLKGATETRIEQGPPLPNRPAREIDVGVSLGLAGYF